MYKLMAALSLLVRQFYVPNPFEPRADAWLLNVIVEPFVHSITFAIVGLFYKRGSEPALGSFLYLLFYFVHTGLLMAMGFFKWEKIAMISIVVVYIIIIAIIKSMANFTRFK